MLCGSINDKKETSLTHSSGGWRTLGKMDIGWSSWLYLDVGRYQSRMLKYDIVSSFTLSFCVVFFVCSVEWMGRDGGNFLAVGTNHSAVQLWDASKLRQVLFEEH